MFGRAIWDKFPKCIFENSEIAQINKAISKFSNITWVIYPKNRLEQTYNYWLITPNQLTFCIETNIFQQLHTSKRTITKQRTITVQNNTFKGTSTDT